MPAAAGEKQRNEKSDLQGSVQRVAGGQNRIAGGLGGLADDEHLGGRRFSAVSFRAVLEREPMARITLS